MPKIKRFWCLGLGLMLLAFISAAAEEQTVVLGLSADYYSKYIWRGQNLNEESVFQPAVSVSAYGFTGSIWGNLDLTNSNSNSGQFNEFDWSLDYTAKAPGTEKLNFSAGAIYYRFPHTTFHPTTEVYAGLSIDTLLSPSIKWYRDVDVIDGSYIQLGIGHLFEKIVSWNENRHCGLQLGASIGWASSAYNDGYFGVNNSGLNDLTLSTGLCFQVDSWMIRPNINYSTMLDDDIRRATDKSDNVWFGVGITTSF